MVQEFFFPICAPSNNDMHRWLKGNRGQKIYIGEKNRLKSRVLSVLCGLTFDKFPAGIPLQVTFSWVEKDYRRDVDSCSMAGKWVLDALVDAGVIEDDGRKYVKRIVHEMLDGLISKEFPGVYVRVETLP